MKNKLFVLFFFLAAVSISCAMEQPPKSVQFRLVDALKDDNAYKLTAQLDAYPQFLNAPLACLAGKLPLHFAVSRGAIHCVSALLERGAAPNARDAHGYEALQYVGYCNFCILHDLAFVLLKHGANIFIELADGRNIIPQINGYFYDLVMEAVRDQTAEKLEQLIQVNPGRMVAFLRSRFIQRIAAKRVHPLHEAARGVGKTAHTKLLVRYGALVTDIISKRQGLFGKEALNVFHCVRHDRSKFKTLITGPYAVPEPHVPPVLMQRMIALHCLLNRVSADMPRDIENMISKWLLVAEQSSVEVLRYFLPYGLVDQPQVVDALVDWHINQVSLALLGTNCSSSPQKHLLYHYRLHAVEIVNGDPAAIKKNFGDEIRKGYEEILGV